MGSTSNRGAWTAAAFTVARFSRAIEATPNTTRAAPKLVPMRKLRVMPVHSIPDAIVIRSTEAAGGIIQDSGSVYAEQIRQDEHITDDSDRSRRTTPSRSRLRGN